MPPPGRRKPGREPEPDREPERTSGRKPERTPGHALERTPSREPERTPGRELERTPSCEPERTPGREPERTPSRDPGREPGRTPGHAPEREPGRTPGHAPERTPGHEPERTPGREPELTPGHAPERTPGREPEHTPSRAPERTPGHEPEHTPSREPERTPGHAPERTPSREPERTPGRRPARTRRRSRMAAIWLAGLRLQRQRLRFDHNLIFLRLLSGLDPETGEKWVWRDPGLAAAPIRFVIQAGLAALVMLAILTFVQSLSFAAIAAGLASSVVGIFITPSNRTAQIRAVVGGHIVALALGSIFSLILFLGPIETLIGDADYLRNLAYATAVGLAILLMAVTNTEHPPAAGTAIGMASREFDILIFFSIIGAVIMLAAIKLALRPYLRDLT